HATRRRRHVCGIYQVLQRSQRRAT
ncbi:hypothetical protein BN1723_020777, partial [Verticillium longisporum]